MGRGLPRWPSAAQLLSLYRSITLQQRVRTGRLSFASRLLFYSTRNPITLQYVKLKQDWLKGIHQTLQSILFLLCIASPVVTDDVAGEGSKDGAADQQRTGLMSPCTDSPTVILFPGQGSQYVGMGSALLERPSVQDMFGSASEILKLDLQEACLKGPLDFLSRTQVQQPAILVCSLAALDKLQADNPAAVENCVATAGFSLGEVTALTFAGALSFEDAVRIIKVRAEGMQEASEATPGGLLTVFTGPDSDLESCVEAALQSCLSSGVTSPECKVANYLAPNCRVVGGSEQALQYVADHAADFRLKRVKRVNVSGAFHTTHMAPAAGALATALEHTPITNPRIPVLANIDAAPYNSPDQIRKYLPRQVLSSVLWEHTLRALYEAGPGGPVPRTFECGPGKSLKAIVKMVNTDAFANTFNVEA